ncbi:MAG: hypothetical protein NT069_18875, partial [Planctomycetota bacterium]|nr:hypothetical protein [Planctomycetota bacterium]
MKTRTASASKSARTKRAGVTQSVSTATGTPKSSGRGSSGAAQNAVIGRRKSSGSATGASKVLSHGGAVAQASISRSDTHDDPTLPARVERLIRQEIGFIHNRLFARANLVAAKAEFAEMS